MRLLFVIAVLLCSGCGSGSPFDYVEVSGTLTYDDGTPIPAPSIRLQFAAQDAPAVEGAHPRPAVANVDDKGMFECATSYKYGDGLIPGQHKVAVQQATGPGGRLLVPKEYTSIATTPLMVNTEDAPLEIKVPKP
jgi:hypothetical protein